MFLRTNRSFRHRKTGKVSEHIMDLVGDSVVVDKDFVASKDQLHEYRTLFKDIMIHPYQMIHPGSENFKYGPGLKMGYREFIGYLLDNIELVIKDTWDDDKFHVISHSSGYDSRILSYIIRKLYRRGIIAGDILFLCLQPEGEGFQEVMRYLNWDGEKCLVYNKNCRPEEYYKGCFDFKNNWRSFNGLSQWPGDILFWVIKDLQKKKLLPQDDKNIQSYGMGFTDELFKHKYHFRTKASVYKFLNIYYYSRFPQSMSNFKGDRIMPMLDFEIIKLILMYDWGWHPSAKVKMDLVKRLDPKLYELPNKSIYTTKNPYHRISPELMDKIKTDYSRSWYGKNINPDMVKRATSNLEYSPWWACYSAAAVVEHLRELGVKISTP